MMNFGIKLQQAQYFRRAPAIEFLEWQTRQMDFVFWMADAVISDGVRSASLSLVNDIFG
jgi:hypothetical protein